MLQRIRRLLVLSLLIAALALAPLASASPVSTAGSWWTSVVEVVDGFWDLLVGTAPLPGDAQPQDGDAGSQTDPLG